MSATHQKDTTPALPATTGPDPLSLVKVMSTPELARHANIEGAQASGRALFHACRAGAFLLAARERVPHGGWLSWLAAHWEGSRQQADRYMDIAEACGGDTERLGELKAESIRGALSTLGKPVETSVKPKDKTTQIAHAVSNLKDEATDAEFTVTGTARPNVGPALSSALSPAEAAATAVSGRPRTLDAPAPAPREPDPESSAGECREIANAYDALRRRVELVKLGAHVPADVERESLGPLRKSVLALTPQWKDLLERVATADKDATDYEIGRRERAAKAKASEERRAAKAATAKQRRAECEAEASGEPEEEDAA